MMRALSFAQRIEDLFASRYLRGGYVIGCVILGRRLIETHMVLWWIP